MIELGSDNNQDKVNNADSTFIFFIILLISRNGQRGQVCMVCKESQDELVFLYSDWWVLWRIVKHIYAYIHLRNMRCHLCTQLHTKTVESSAVSAWAESAKIPFRLWISFIWKGWCGNFSRSFGRGKPMWEWDSHKFHAGNLKTLKFK